MLAKTAEAGVSARDALTRSDGGNASIAGRRVHERGNTHASHRVLRVDFREAVLELSRLQGQTVLFQVRPVGHEGSLFEMLDRIDRVWADEHATYVVFFDAESSIVMRPAAFSEADWGTGWRRGDEEERQLRIRLGSVDLGFLPS